MFRGEFEAAELAKPYGYDKDVATPLSMSEVDTICEEAKRDLYPIQAVKIEKAIKRIRNFYALRLAYNP